MPTAAATRSPASPSNRQRPASASAQAVAPAAASRAGTTQRAVSPTMPGNGAPGNPWALAGVIA